jgi:hypothetical protein
VSHDLEVDVRYGILSTEGEREGNIRGQSKVRESFCLIRWTGADCSARDLEKAVEDLSELLEQPIDTETIGVLRQKVTDKTVSDLR